MNKQPRGVTLPGAENIETVILDMDGTLLDLHFDQEVWYRLLPERFARTRGCSVDAARTEVSALMGAVKGTFAWYRLDHWHAILGIDLEELEIELAHLVRPRPGAIEFLETLAKTHHRIVLATNAQPSSMQRKFDITGIDRYFDSIRSSHYYGMCKEDPVFWPTFTSDLSIDPSMTMLIDDTHAVLLAAQQFGVAYNYGIRRPSTHGPEIAFPEFHCLDTFDELIAVIKEN